MCFALVAISSPVYAAGLLTPKDSGLPVLDIKDHNVKVVIEDGYAITTVDQSFFNPHGKDLEAVYSFPVPDKAAVSEFTMWIDGKPINGEVLEKKKAREVYEDQKSKNKNTGITEKNEYKTFEISVYPVKVGQETKIRLSYIQPAQVDTSVGRYVYQLEEGGVDEEALAFWTTNEKVTGTFSFDLVVRSGYPVASIRLPNHPSAEIIQQGDKWLVHLDNTLNSVQSNKDQDAALTINNQQDLDAAVQPVAQIDTAFRLNTDIVVYYKHAENLPGSVGLVAYKEEAGKRGTFMMTVTPGMDLQPLAGGRDWVFILDISGSMQGKYATLAEGVSRALNQLNPNDRFRIVLFNSRESELTNGFVNATPANIDQYVKAVTAVQPNESTNLYAGLQLGLKRLDSDRTSSLILVTDGVANVGETQQRKFIELLKQYDVRLFTFIMGNSANEPLLTALTRVSNGFAINVSNSDDIIGKILLAQSKVNFQALHGAKVQISGIKTVDINPKDIGSVYRGQQLIVFGHYFGSGRANITLSGKIAGQEKAYTTEFDFPDVALENPEIERLWAYATIETLMQDMEDFGEDPDMKNSITDLGVEYGLVTDYTSMVVVEDDVFQELGIDRRNMTRIKKEYAAREVRAVSTPRSTRVDSASPMFNNNRPTFAGGAGALDPMSVLIFSPLLWGLKPRSKKSNKRVA
ncbi:MAG: VIT and VWA domain-containing protein [Candidatus Omnitrophica bacterium]|nr:VIT and VWA domain-containing protein [Candidatus Omnitrophota bacterium]MBU1997032.1 VIT and VWA domain-containing protein [Candidatus Omnitrophota bacterium]MBU4333171.1 VIT and VWA domain-containing protein [Candidatus Omnitrophota bacterium]